MEITWNISQLDRRTSDGFVTTAHWNCIANDEGFFSSIYSTCGWTEGEIVIPYESLTKEAVLEWVWASGVDKEATEAAAIAAVEQQKAPVQSSGLPWGV